MSNSALLQFLDLMAMSFNFLTLTPEPLSIAIATAKGFLSVGQPILKLGCKYSPFQIATVKNSTALFLCNNHAKHGKL
tara:strand:- start:15330 stop:15563 length:234 start_codon:yes stop_codon:yes gene_type:complete